MVRQTPTVGMGRHGRLGVPVHVNETPPLRQDGDRTYNPSVDAPVHIGRRESVSIQESRYEHSRSVQYIFPVSL